MQWTRSKSCQLESGEANTAKGTHPKWQQCEAKSQCSQTLKHQNIDCMYND